MISYSLFCTFAFLCVCGSSILLNQIILYIRAGRSSVPSWLSATGSLVVLFIGTIIISATLPLLLFFYPVVALLVAGLNFHVVSYFSLSFLSSFSLYLSDCHSSLLRQRA